MTEKILYSPANKPIETNREKMVEILPENPFKG
jgi:hypothetical protein